MPPKEIRELRDYTRLRAELVEERTRQDSDMRDSKGQTDPPAAIAKILWILGVSKPSLLNTALRPSRRGNSVASRQRAGPPTPGGDAEQIDAHDLYLALHHKWT